MEEFSLPTNEASPIFEEELPFRDPESQHSFVDDRLLAVIVLNEALWTREQNTVEELLFLMKTSSISDENATILRNRHDRRDMLRVAEWILHLRFCPPFQCFCKRLSPPTEYGVI